MRRTRGRRYPLLPELCALVAVSGPRHRALEPISAVLLNANATRNARLLRGRSGSCTFYAAARIGSCPFLRPRAPPAHLRYVMAARVSLLLRGLGLAFGVQLKTARLWRPYAEQGLRDARSSAQAAN